MIGVVNIRFYLTPPPVSLSLLKSLLNNNNNNMVDLGLSLSFTIPNNNNPIPTAVAPPATRDDHDCDRACSRGISDEEDCDCSRKKLRLTKDQSYVLEETFKQHNTLNPRQKQSIAKRLRLTPRQVEVWFQNRRARTKLKQTEIDYEFLKRCCETLTEENRRLQKEIQELRAVKLTNGNGVYMQMKIPPPATAILNICPSCERVAVAVPAPVPISPPINIWGDGR